MAGTLSRENPRAFVENLTKPQRKIFGQLQELVSHQESRLVWYHETGSKVLELQGAVAKRERGWTPGLAAALGLSRSNLTKVRKFAADFTRRQAERLDQRGGNWGMVLAVQHSRTQDRMKLLEEALAKGWGVTDLQAAVKQRFGVHNPGGRPLRAAQGIEDGLGRLQALNHRWLRFHRDLWMGGDVPLRDRLRDLSAQELRRLMVLLTELRDTMQKVHRSAQAAEKFIADHGLKMG